MTDYLLAVVIAVALAAGLFFGWSDPRGDAPVPVVHSIRSAR